MRRGALLRLYLAASYAFPLIAHWLLRKRLARGKEHPHRWREKLGLNLVQRPKGKLIWLNAVGLGEVLSLRGLIARMALLDPQATFLVTSTTRTSAEVFARNLPPRTIHQFLPIDASNYRRRFLDHFRPDLCIWAEQDLWPGLVSDLAKRGIPQTMVAARMGPNSFQKHNRMKALYRDLYSAMDFITAQNETTAIHLSRLGATQTVHMTGSLKPAAPALDHDPGALAQIRAALGSRMVWAVAPSHPEDEVLAIAAHQTLLETDPDALLIIAPRFPDRRNDIIAQCPKPPKLRSRAQVPGPDDPIWVCDTFGELGLIYHLANIVLIGGTFGDVEGHSPWEAITLGRAVAHGPRIDNFADDYAALTAAKAAAPVASIEQLVTLLQSPERPDLIANASDLVAVAETRVNDLAVQLAALIRPAT